uniref:Uncharacterized protein n=1 Tax=Acrobeloides nanus TaxID=290746 RepID=A0A914CTG3_9BILA
MEYMEPERREDLVKENNSVGTSTGLPQFKHKVKSNDNFSMDNRHELSSRLLRSNSLILTPNTLDTNSKFRDVYKATIEKK